MFRNIITLLQLLIMLKTTGHNIKWNDCDILASGKTDYHCKVKKALLIERVTASIECQCQQ